MHLLLGNHEVLNADLDFGYVGGGGSWHGWDEPGAADAAPGAAAAAEEAADSAIGGNALR